MAGAAKPQTVEQLAKSHAALAAQPWATWRIKDTEKGPLVWRANEHFYGFRPNRSTHHAVLRCQQMMQKGFTWVIEGDVKACFDEISHHAGAKSRRPVVGCNRRQHSPG